MVSFAGWDPQRINNLQLLQQRINTHLTSTALHMNNATTTVRTLFFTQDDLPEQYYQDFQWSFAKPHYHGFWTWKPWILRNLTQTNVFQQGDLVVWMDSDETIDLQETAYFKMALCNMEHRNHNYGGIFPFVRCFGHVEADYTKPDVFLRMGLNSTVWGAGEQIYAGSLGFRVVPEETLAFLREWENWARIPVMFGDDVDFPSSDTATNATATAASGTNNKRRKSYKKTQE